MTKNWCIGLDSQQINALREALGDAHEVAAYPSAGEALASGEIPFLIWTDTTGCAVLARSARDILPDIDMAPKVLVLQPEYTLADFESACDNGITEILRPPLNRERVADIMRRALDMRAVHHDIDCMAREIVLERELLERKNEILEFLVNFVTHSTESLELDSILESSYTGFGKLFPVTALHTAMWSKDGDAPRLCLRIAAERNSAAYTAWQSTLTEHALSATGIDFCNIDVQPLSLSRQPDDPDQSLMEQEVPLTLPLSCCGEQFGVLILLTAMERHLGRDKAMALDSAIRHLSLTLKNANRFMTMRQYADYDALTGLHSRRHFDSRLEEELLRFSRYREPLSMIMLDIDHFKRVNDAYGHHTGDMVLQHTARLVADSIRTIDYSARYGGEEFVVMLPHTTGKKAMALAERIRTAIAEHPFTINNGQSLPITVSLGVACLDAGSVNKTSSLLRDADSALYMAKNNGRNQCSYFRPEVPSKPVALTACHESA